MRTVRRPLRVYFRWPFFSSCDRTDAASFLLSAGVGFLSPLRTFEAKVDSLLEDCFFGMIGMLRDRWTFYDQSITYPASTGAFGPDAGGLVSPDGLPHGMLLGSPS
jgi:hypothetical protein